MLNDCLKKYVGNDAVSNSFKAFPNASAEALDRYITDHCPTGEFLESVLSNDLKNSVLMADHQNIHLLRDYMLFLYNYAPSVCWGSPENVKAWLNPKVINKGVKNHGKS